MTTETPTREGADRITRTALLTVAPEAELDTLSPGENLREALELDSMDFLAFAEQLSEATGRRIDESDYDRLTTLESCIEFLSGR
ncbi:phosphopantetheine-binding protein [Amycolatopsis mongoliensis]|uniref:Phosphopantetheine-binding protein n=1 Tax=Amycolatopsis mongoliensis TaxID=715475 RepID=A0A9Y2JNH3_9PSEU|nr:phosphopantetheine-binding protein [Amycolatopsis sp. 4-36]WIY00507.1 phosphopantetheine-binding protein [Amycolatopsis sp. 4-36]